MQYLQSNRNCVGNAVEILVESSDPIFPCLTLFFGFFKNVGKCGKCGKK